ncbi:hypothetical protein [Bradyrhizobium prioriisuperbiae]|uniref:hypothetical protein n=1 Tax=Bradyrhizobium prioriisuperbiae TaxID=2854389 RepID=UPI0028EEB5EE|nr:hypothetical protein [Bradyrhizobium prioritasuperba]
MAAGDTYAQITDDDAVLPATKLPDHKAKHPNQKPEGHEDQSADKEGGSKRRFQDQDAEQDGGCATAGHCQSNPKQQHASLPFRYRSDTR